MFLGHFGLAMALKPKTPQSSLGTLTMATQWVDLIWPFFLFAGLEQVVINPGTTPATPLEFVHYPFTHSLLGAFLWALAFGGIYYVIRRQIKSALIVGLAVLSHWFLDLIVHVPDLPLSFADTPKFGLGLWNFLVPTLVLELIFFIGGCWIYLKKTSAKDRIGSFGFYAYAAFLFVVYLGAVFGPPPDNVTALAGSGLILWLLPLWAAWVDRHRQVG